MSRNANKKAETIEFKTRKSRILYQITALLIAVLVVSGLATFFIVRDSQERLIDNSIDKLIENNAAKTLSTYEFMASGLIEEMEAMLEETDQQLFVKAIMNEEIVAAQDYVNDELHKMTEGGLLGFEVLFVLLPPSPVFPKTTAVNSSDRNLVYNWDVPDYVIEAMGNDTSYILREEGIPELGCAGEYLIILVEIEDSPGEKMGMGAATLAAVIPMEDEISQINSFYNDERRKTNIILGIVVGVTIAIVFLISFFILSFLIRKRITEPVDKLSTAATEVMDGNLEVEINVHEGGDFEGLERAFREMVGSLKRMIARSVGEE